MGIFSGRVEYLDDIDYADDVADLACAQAHFQDKLWQAASYVGLEINAPKTRVMYINTTLDASLKIASGTLECVDSFTYLGSVIIGMGLYKETLRTYLEKLGMPLLILDQFGSHWSLEISC